MMVLNQNSAHLKNSSSLTFSSINIVLISQGDMSRDHFAKNRKLLTNWYGRFKKRNQAITFF